MSTDKGVALGKQLPNTTLFLFFSIRLMLFRLLAIK